MPESFALGAPHSSSAIIASRAALEVESHDFFAALPAAAFFVPQGDRWSPSEHARHLTKSVGAVAKGLAAPRIAIRLLYGAHQGPSRDLATVQAVYRERLARGASAGGFAPEPRPVPTDLEAGRVAVLARFRSAGSDLRRAMAKWNEQSLDRLRMPHPLLGKLTVREMCLFTLYHNAHHVRLAAARAAASGRQD